MSEIPVRIQYQGRAVKVTDLGELVVGPISFDDTQHHAMSSSGTAYHFYGPVVGKQFILTGFVAVSDKNITSDAIIEIYEATSPTSTSVLKQLFHFALTKNDNISLTPLRIKVSPGLFVNAKTDDATIHITIVGYYVPIV